MHNITKNFDPVTGAAVVPSAYKIGSIEIENHIGNVVDIKEGTTEIEIKESLYTPYLIISIKFQDEYNFFEDLPIIGEEKIHLKLFRKTKDITIPEEEISFTFNVTEYTDFTRPYQEHVSLYTINGITNPGFLSKFKQISRSVSGLTVSEINNILKKDLSIAEINTLGNCASRFKGIINWQTPLEAVNWLLSKSFDENFTPFFCWQSFSGSHNIISLSELVKNEKYFTYRDARQFVTEPGTAIHYEELQQRILEINSDVRLAKGILAMDGCYAAHHHYLDYSNKKFTKAKFKGVEPQVEGNSSLSTASEFQLKDQFEVKREYVPLNDISFGKATKNFNNLKKESGGKLRAFYEGLELYSHTIKLYGDMNLSSGIIIELDFPKAHDPSINKGAGLSDEHLSGRYLIDGTVHQFNMGEYHTWVQVKRDSFKLAI
jgi:hypothetical protein